MLVLFPHPSFLELTGVDSPLASHHPQLRSLPLSQGEELVASKKSPSLHPKNPTDTPALTTFQVGSGISSATPSVDIVS